MLCEWSETSHHDGGANINTPADIYPHFQSSEHVLNWIKWRKYFVEQNLQDDYMEDWFAQQELLDIHRYALSELGVGTATH